MEKINVIKVGGAVVEDEQQLDRLLKDFSAIEVFVCFELIISQ